MKELNICVDIDGTITDPYYWLPVANNYFQKEIKPEEVTEYSIQTVMNITNDKFEEFYERVKFEIHENPKIKADAKEILDGIIDKHNIYFVTARDKELEMLTHMYLRKKQIPYDDIFVLGSHYKVDKARELKCDIFIEDSYDNAVQLSNSGFRVLLMDTNYNRKQLNNKITRVYNWKEILFIINEFALHDNAM